LASNHRNLQRSLSHKLAIVKIQIVIVKILKGGIQEFLWEFPMNSKRRQLTSTDPLQTSLRSRLLCSAGLSSKREKTLTLDKNPDGDDFADMTEGRKAGSLFSRKSQDKKTVLYLWQVDGGGTSQLRKDVLKLVDQRDDRLSKKRSWLGRRGERNACCLRP
jgi:hypothetical protein